MQPLFGKHVRQRILVVESDQAIAGRLSELIADVSTRYEVLRACSGFEGLQKVENGVVHIVLAAEKLVDMTGSTFIAILQGLKKSKQKEPACVLMTENRRYVKTSETDCPTSFETIKSPVDPEELAYTLDRAMDLDMINKKIAFNVFLGWLLLGLIPVAVGLGVVIRKL